MKNILFIANYFPKFPTLTNFGTWAYDQVRAISQEHQVNVVTFVPWLPFFFKYFIKNSSKWIDVDRITKPDPNITINYIRISPFKYKYFKKTVENPEKHINYFYRKIKKHLKKHYDLIIANNVILEGLIANYIFHQNQSPYFCFEHSPDHFFPVNTLHENAYRKTVMEAAAFVNVSRYSFDLIDKVYHFDNPPVKILYNYSNDPMISVDDTWQTRYPEIKPDRKYLIEVANYENRKNHLLVLDLFHEIKDQHPEWDLIFVGSHRETLPRIEEKIREYRLENRVRLFTDMPHQDVLQLLKHCDIFILPSNAEMFSVSALEALAAGLGLIITCHNGLVDEEFKESTVITVDPTDKTGIRNRLSELMKDEKKLTDVRKANRKLYEDKFTREIYLKNFNRIINDAGI